MREIKFRAWDTTENKMDYDVCISWNGNVICFEYGNYCGDYPKEDVIPMQYTGLTDRNGTEIYEGDIVKTIDGLGVIIYEPKLATFAIEYRSYKITIPHYLDSERGNDLEVLGNIYEHPHLLGSEEK
jgi:uncharacterized phage protein (TIGR01671 family)